MVPAVLLALLVAAAPLPWGGVYPGGLLRIQVLAFTALMATLATGGKLPSPARLPAALAAAIALLGAVQIAPLPAAVVDRLSSTSARIYHESSAVLAAYGRPPLAPRISIAPTETLPLVLLTLAFAAAFLAASSLATPRARRTVVWTLVLTAVVHVIAASVLDGSEGTEGRLHGAYVNPNQMAAALEIALPFALALLWISIVKSRSALVAPEERLEARIRTIVPAALLVAAIAGGIALTRSRGGIAAAAVAIVLFLVLAPLHPSRARRKGPLATTLLATLGIGILLAVSIGGRPFFRFLAADPRDPESDLRPRLWSLSLEAWEQFPLLGSGLGTFREAFRRVQPRDLRGLVEQAHSEPLQMLVTGGIAGAALSAALFLSLFVLLARGWWRQRHREEAAVALAALVALASIALHGLVEFNLSIPAIPATLAVALGVGVAAAARDQTS